MGITVGVVVGFIVGAIVGFVVAYFVFSNNPKTVDKINKVADTIEGE